MGSLRVCTSFSTACGKAMISGWSGRCRCNPRMNETVIVSSYPAASSICTNGDRPLHPVGEELLAVGQVADDLLRSSSGLRRVGLGAGPGSGPPRCSGDTGGRTRRPGAGPRSLVTHRPAGRVQLGPNRAAQDRTGSCSLHLHDEERAGASSRLNVGEEPQFQPLEVAVGLLEADLSQPASASLRLDPGTCVMSRPIRPLGNPRANGLMMIRFSPPSPRPSAVSSYAHSKTTVRPWASVHFGGLHLLARPRMTFSGTGRLQAILADLEPTRQLRRAVGGMARGEAGESLEIARSTPAGLTSSLFLEDSETMTRLDVAAGVVSDTEADGWLNALPASPRGSTFADAEYYSGVVSAKAVLAHTAPARPGRRSGNSTGIRRYGGVRPVEADVPTMSCRAPIGLLSDAGFCAVSTTAARLTRSSAAASPSTSASPSKASPTSNRPSTCGWAILCTDMVRPPAGCTRRSGPGPRACATVTLAAGLMLARSASHRLHGSPLRGRLRQGQAGRRPGGQDARSSRAART